MIVMCSSDCLKTSDGDGVLGKEGLASRVLPPLQDARCKKPVESVPQ